MSMNGLSDEVLAGQAVYSPRTLRLYDMVVLGLSNRFVWRCPTRELLALYDQNVTGNHLDVGVGTGYFLDRCRFPIERPRIVLMDLNENCLAAAATRIDRYKPTTVHRNVLEPIDFAGERFDSIGLNYLLHCLPGTMADKACVFDYLRPLLNPGGVMFGSTLLSDGVTTNPLARRLMAVYNQKGIFCNTADSRSALEIELRRRFAESHVRIVGCAALFRARL